jgi:hypothetical protein
LKSKVLKMTARNCLKILLGALVIQGFSWTSAQSASQHRASQVWPHPIPCRIQDGKNTDLVVMFPGDVETSLADGVFDPSKDEVRLNDGTVKQNYYRDVMGHGLGENREGHYY